MGCIDFKSGVFVLLCCTHAVPAATVTFPSPYVWGFPPRELPVHRWRNHHSRREARNASLASRVRREACRRCTHAHTLAASVFLLRRLILVVFLVRASSSSARVVAQLITVLRRGCHQVTGLELYSDFTTRPRHHGYSIACSKRMIIRIGFY